MESFMQFFYHSYTIECAALLIGDAYVGEATIYSASGGQLIECFRTGLRPPSVSQVQAIGDARNAAEMWCDQH